MMSSDAIPGAAGFAEDAGAFFDNAPTPMWVFDRASLLLRTVNAAAAALFGYEPAALRGMSVLDLRPADTHAALLRRLEDFDRDGPLSSEWTLNHRSGDPIRVEVHWRPIRYDGAPAVLATIRDLSLVATLQRERDRLLATSERLRIRAEENARIFRGLFESVPAKFLVLSAVDWRIVTASDAYLAATMTDRDAIVNRPIFDVFPRVAIAGETGASDPLEASLIRTRDTGRADVMGLHRFPVHRPDSLGGGMDDRYWSIVNSPMLDAEGRVAYIIHRVEDVTAYILSHGTSSDDARDLAVELLSRSADLQRANDQLREVDANTRTARRLLNQVMWSMDAASRAVTWSDNMPRVLGLADDAGLPDMAALLATVHPDDRDDAAQTLGAALEGADSTVKFQYRFVGGDGQVRHLRGAGELTETTAGRRLVGVMQDVTAEVVAEQRLERIRELLQIAGRVARVGGWLYEWQPNQLHWSPEAARIHALAPDTILTPTEAVECYIPEDRERLRHVVDACLNDGTPFDEALTLVAADGRMVHVRTAGQAMRDAQGRIVGIHGAIQDVSELVAARTRTAAMTDRLFSTLESMSDGVLFVTTDRTVTYANSVAERMLHSRPDGLAGLTLADVLGPDDAARLDLRLTEALRTGATVRLTERFGPPVDAWLEVSTHPSVDGLAVFLRDVTAERARTEQLRLMESAVARTNDVVVITGAEGHASAEGPRIVYVNEAYQRLSGFGTGEAIGLHPRFLADDTLPRAEVDRVRAAVAAAQPVRAELLKLRRDGRPYWVEIDIAPLVDVDGKPTHFVSVERDISERRARDEALRLSEERFRLVARATDDVIIDWNFAAGRGWVNEKLTQQFGHVSAEPASVARLWAENVHPDDSARVMEGLDAAMAEGAETWEETYRFRRADGTYAVVIDRGVFVRAADGHVDRMIRLMSDVTTVVKAQERLRQTERMQAVGQLTGGMAHDFNNLLTIILGNAELLAAQLTDPRLRRMAEQSATAAERGADLTRRLLAFARQQPLAPTTVDVGALLKSMDGLLRRTLSAEIALQFDLGTTRWNADVDAGQLELAILYLVLNAQDAMPKGGQLTVGLAARRLGKAAAETLGDLAPGDYVEITVADTGHGMTPEVLAHAFEPFFTTKPDGMGSGLGLSTVWGFAKQSGGHVAIQSRPGAGTAVRIYLPRAAADTRGDAAMTDMQPSPDDAHVLVVEDDDFVREHVCEQLRTLGYHVSSAANGAEAMKVVQSDTIIDLLLTDVVMPGGMNGRQLADAARQLRPGLRVLFTSGYSENVLMEDDRLPPDIQLLSKPYRRQELANKVRQVLASA